MAGSGDERSAAAKPPAGVRPQEERSDGTERTRRPLSGLWRPAFQRNEETAESTINGCVRITFREGF